MGQKQRVAMLANIIMGINNDPQEIFYRVQSNNGRQGNCGHNTNFMRLTRNRISLLHRALLRISKYASMHIQTWKLFCQLSVLKVRISSINPSWSHSPNYLERATTKQYSEIFKQANNKKWLQKWGSPLFFLLTIVLFCVPLVVIIMLKSRTNLFTSSWSKYFP